MSTPSWFFLTSGQAKIDFSVATGAFDPRGTTAIFQGKTLPAPPHNPNPVVSSAVLGESTGEKRIEVDLTRQYLYAFEGDRKVYEFPVSTGKPWTPTPTGEFRTWIKLRYTKMSGGSQALGTYYYLPNVPYVMFFQGDNAPSWKGYAIHGAYWHINFGRPMSHGCVNMLPGDAEKIYYWADPQLTDGKASIKATTENPGVRIVIYGTTPRV